jgi:hypothetical protein
MNPPGGFCAELVGVAGAGKTTLLELATSRLSMTGIAVLPQADREPLPPKGWRPDWWAEALRHCEWAVEPQRLIGTCLRTAWQAGRPGVHPEGMVHMASRLAWESASDLTALVAVMPVADLVVHVTTDIGTAAARVAGKPGRVGYINQQLRRAGPDDWYRAARTCHAIVEQVAGRTAIVEIDNSGDPAPAVEQLIDVVTNAAGRAADSEQVLRDEPVTTSAAN